MVILGLATAGVFGLAAGVSGQVRIDTGRANDANPRVGSYGYNTGGVAPSTYDGGRFANDVVTGNVTGGRAFRGTVPYTDPNELRIRTAGANVDRFVRDTTAVTTQGAVINNAQRAQRFYGDSQTVAPPPGFTTLPYTGGYVPARPEFRQAGDARLGAVLLPSEQFDQRSADPVSTLPGQTGGLSASAGLSAGGTLPSGQQGLDGPGTPGGFIEADADIDPFTDPLVATAGGRTRAISPFTAIRTPDAGLTPQQLREFRRQLLPDARLSDGARPLDRGEALDRGTFGGDAAVGRPLDAPSDGRLGPVGPDARRADPSVDGTLNADLGLSGAARQRQRLISPAEQSTQYAALQSRLRQFEGLRQDPASRQATRTLPDDPRDPFRPGFSSRPLPSDAGDAMAADRFAGRLPSDQADDVAPEERVGQIDLPPRTPRGEEAGQPTARIGRGPAQDARPDRPDAAPVRIGSLAEGVNARGLRGLLEEAETLMRDGRFTTAIERYDAAEQVAPNNPLVRLGRGNAELGAGFYRRAEASLRGAVAADQALLMGRYDLLAHLGQERMDTLVADLKQQATDNAERPGPLFLLAWIDYNTGNERRALGYVDLAEQRSGGDPFYATLRDLWSAPVNPESRTK